MIVSDLGNDAGINANDTFLDLTFTYPFMSDELERVVNVLYPGYIIP